METNLSYPIGRFSRKAVPTPETRRAAIADIQALPVRMRAAVAGLTDAQLDTPYRPGGWTVRQTVHHVADSHMNGLIRAKLGLTENTPTIKAYDQDAWVALPDAKLPVGVSLTLLDSLHERWSALYAGLGDEAFGRAFVHPEQGPMTLEIHLHLYAWHGRHHVAHITGLREREGW